MTPTTAPAAAGTAASKEPVHFAYGTTTAEVAGMRINYEQDVLLESQAKRDPYEQFAAWFEDAKRTEREPNAMCLSTVGRDGRPSGRIVLLKGYGGRGFTFYTNYRSRKSQELFANPFASLTFYWGERSVRIEGPCTEVPAEESDAYFASRPRGSQIGAWASANQSAVLPSGRDDLEKALEETKAKFGEQGETPVPRPEFWGGFRVAPDRIEFWQGRPSRLHDRLVYVKETADAKWKIERLSPFLCVTRAKEMKAAARLSDDDDDGGDTSSTATLRPRGTHPDPPYPDHKIKLLADDAVVGARAATGGDDVYGGDRARFYRQTALLLLTTVPEIMIHHMLTPFYPYIVRALLPGKEPGRFVGLMASAFFLPTIVGAPLMGYLSDTYGRKISPSTFRALRQQPVLVVGLMGFSFGTIILGLSTVYATSLLALFITGCFAGNAVVAKSMIGEMGRNDKERALGYSGYGVVFGAAGILGTFLGGYMADSALLASNPFLQQRPSFLACTVGSMFGMFALAVTLKTMKEPPRPATAAPGAEPPAVYGGLTRTGSDADLPGATAFTVLRKGLHAGGGPGARLWARLLRLVPTQLYPYLAVVHARTVPPILVYALMQLGNGMVHTTLSLLVEAPLESGGYHLGSKQMAMASMVGSMAKLFIKAAYVPIHSRLTTLGCFRAGVGMFIPPLLIAPLRLGSTADSAPLAPLLLCSLFLGAGEGLAYLSLVMFLTDSVPTKQLGTLHGLAACMGSITKTIGPIVGGMLWEIGPSWLPFGMTVGIAAGALGFSGALAAGKKRGAEQGAEEEEQEVWMEQQPRRSMVEMDRIEGGSA
ncbi:hypothetical protein HDU96_007935 [Phlyctochytrium bullatum]|nr:hypothetical protein HDU96_007935 [Phlyctochytrium bullatum]